MNHNKQSIVELREKIKVIVCDLDGTLLSSYNTIPDFTKDYLKKFSYKYIKDAPGNSKDKNMHFVIATGRPYQDVIKIKESIGVPAYLITSNGACIHDSENNLIEEKTLDPSIAKEILKLEYNNDKVLTNIYKNNGWYINRIDSEAAREASFFTQSRMSYNEDPFDFNSLDTNGIYKIYFSSVNRDELYNIKEKIIRQPWADKIEICFSLSTSLEIMGIGVNKGAALKRVLENINSKYKSNLTLKECMAFGDGENDIPMLSIVNKGILMENADVLIVDKLSHLEKISSNNDEAVAKYLSKIFVV